MEGKKMFFWKHKKIKYTIPSVLLTSVGTGKLLYIFSVIRILIVCVLSTIGSIQLEAYAVPNPINIINMKNVFLSLALILVALAVNAQSPPLPPVTLS